MTEEVARDVAQLVEFSFSVHETLVFIPSATQSQALWRVHAYSPGEVEVELRSSRPSCTTEFETSLNVALSQKEKSKTQRPHGSSTRF